MRPTDRLARFGAACGVLVVACGAAVLHAHAVRRARAGAWPIQRVAARAAGAELALHSASRWLRHPTRSEPWAASADGPAMLDQDPAGALAPPPTEVLRAGWPGTTVTVRRVGR